MAQTTGAISSKDFKVEFSSNGTTWTDASGSAVMIDPGQGKRKSGDKATFDGDLPIVTTGKRDFVISKVEYVYTEGASDLFETARAAFENTSALYLRYAPKGGQAGEFLFTSASGLLEAFDYPKGNADDGAPVVLGFDLKHGGWTKSVAV